jgi:hypothetical protein
MVLDRDAAALKYYTSESGGSLKGTVSIAGAK